MNKELFIRVFKVACGDCIFLRIPDKDKFVHVVVDCGNFLGDKEKPLKDAVKNIRDLLNHEDLPENQKGILDLLVLTHQHWDHMKGFESALEEFKKLNIQRIWLSKAMDENNKGSTEYRALQAMVGDTYKILNDTGIRLSEDLHSWFRMLTLSKAESLEAITDTLPQHNDIKPCYIYRGIGDALTGSQKKKCLIPFEDSSTTLKLLAPEKDIDGAYLPAAFSVIQEQSSGKKALDSSVPEQDRIEIPPNISRSDFMKLKTQLFHTSLLLAELSGKAANNTSIVFLLEWKGKRLLFSGDAQLESWDQMWKNEKKALNTPVHFLKVSHHGSHNGTPFHADDPGHVRNQIFDAILPVKGKKNARAIVSTLAGRIKATDNPVPHPALMNEIAKRISNSKKYDSESGRQPQRTDLEPNAEGWVDFIFKENGS